MVSSFGLSPPCLYITTFQIIANEPQPYIMYSVMNISVQLPLHYTASRGKLRYVRRYLGTNSAGDRWSPLLFVLFPLRGRTSSVACRWNLPHLTKGHSGTWIEDHSGTWTEGEGKARARVCRVIGNTSAERANKKARRSGFFRYFLPNKNAHFTSSPWTFSIASDEMRTFSLPAVRSVLWFLKHSFKRIGQRIEERMIKRIVPRSGSMPPAQIRFLPVA